MSYRLLLSSAYAFLLLGFAAIAGAQTQPAADSVPGKKFIPAGQLWGYAFGDFAYKAHADTVGGGRGGSNQYTRVPKDMNLFQFRRVYLGFNYDIAPRFSAEFLLAAEDDVAAGDVLADNKFAPYVKLANIRWKGIYPGADLVFGLVTTPAYSTTAEAAWGYRSIERNVADIRRTPSFDFGAVLQGKLPGHDNIGYDLMVGNGGSSRPENDKFKAFYGDVYARLLQNKLLLHLYADYQRINWMPGFHHDRHMLKGTVAYSGKLFTVGAEAFINTLRADNIGIRRDLTGRDTLTTNAAAISLFVRGRIYKDKLGYFARYDYYNPAGDNDNGRYLSYSAMTSQYDVTAKEQFITAGIDFTPVKNVHIMPNIWYDSYSNAGPADYGSANKDYDLVYRITLFYIYGK